jgi:hypothetical protein
MKKAGREPVRLRLKKTAAESVAEGRDRPTEASGIDPADPIFHLKPISYRDKSASERIDEIAYGRRKRSS